MNDDKMNENLDLLNLDEEVEMEALPEADLFANNPRPKKPWLLIGVGIGIFVLASFIIIGFMKSDSSSSIEVDLDGPTTVSVDMPEHMARPVHQVRTETVQVVRQPNTQTVQPATVGPVVPVRQIEDRKEVMFRQEAARAAAAQQQAAVQQRQVAAAQATAPKPVTTTTTVKTTQQPVQRVAVNTVQKPSALPAPQKTVKKTTTTATKVAGDWFVQLGSYSTNKSATDASKKLQAKHAGLLKDKKIITVSAVLKGKTMHRLRVPFVKQADAKGFCLNAKSDGLDCYVTK